MKELNFSTKPIMYDIKDVNRVSFHIFFPVKFSKKHLGDRVLTKRMLQTCSNKYNTPELLGNAYDDNYILKYSVNTLVSQSHEMIHFKMTVPKDKLIKNYDIERTIEFLHELIFNPYADNNQFDPKHFEWEKDFILEGSKDYPRSIGEYAWEEYNKFVDPKGKYFVAHDQYINIVKKTTPKSAYNYYKKTILNNNYFTFITGAIDNKKELLLKFDKYFSQGIKDLNYKVEFYNIAKPKKYEYKELVKDYNQSVLIKHYNIKNFKPEERIKLLFLMDLLASEENNLIYHKLRIENNLIYHSNVNHVSSRGVISIIVFLDYNDIPTVNSLISEVFEQLKDKDFFNMCKNRTIKALTYDLLSKEDFPFYDVNDKIDCMISNAIPLKERAKLTKKITYEEMMDFIDRLVNSKDMVVKGGDSHE